MTAIEPERLLVRRALPFVAPAVALAFLIGWLAGGPNAAVSAAIGTAVVAANFAANALATAWGARTSPVMLYGVVLGGFFVRMVVLVALLLALREFAWFSVIAFAIAVVPATIALLIFEARILAARTTQADLWYFRETTG
jgi:ATP synthase I chain